MERPCDGDYRLNYRLISIPFGPGRALAMRLTRLPTLALFDVFVPLAPGGYSVPNVLPVTGVKIRHLADALGLARK